MSNVPDWKPWCVSWWLTKDGAEDMHQGKSTSSTENKRQVQKVKQFTHNRLPSDHTPRQGWYLT